MSPATKHAPEPALVEFDDEGEIGTVSSRPSPAPLRTKVGAGAVQRHIDFADHVVEYQFVEPTIEHRVAASLNCAARGISENLGNLYWSMMQQCVLSVNGTSIPQTPAGRAQFWASTRYALAVAVNNDFAHTITQEAAELGN